MQGPIARIGLLAAAIATTTDACCSHGPPSQSRPSMGARRRVRLMNETQRETAGRNRGQHQDFRQRRHRHHRCGRGHHLTR